MAEKKEVRKLLGRVSKSDDQHAFKMLFDCYHDWLYTVAYTIIQSNEEAEEIVEDVFVKFWEIRGRYDQIENIETYLYTATKNKCYDQFRKKGKIQLVELDEKMVDFDFMQSPEDTFLYKELENKIADSINRLPPKCQQIYRLIKESGSSYKNAAKELGVSQKTIEGQMRIAIKRIADDINAYLDSRDVEDKVKFLSFSVFLLV